jgi:hypothetical protein
VSILIFFKPGKIFSETQIYGNNFKILNSQQPLKEKFQFTRYFSSLSIMFSPIRYGLATEGRFYLCGSAAAAPQRVV